MEKLYNLSTHSGLTRNLCIYTGAGRESLEDSKSQADLKTDLHTDSLIEDGTYKLRVFEHNLGSIVQTQGQDLGRQAKN